MSTMKITFLGAGSTVFVRNLMGDCICTPALGKFEIALYDIDAARLHESYVIVEAINQKYGAPAAVRMYDDAEAALKGAKYVINAIQVGGYKPCTVIDFDIPKKYGLQQCIGDTTGIGGIFRALRTIPVMENYCRIIERVCPHALLINYTNPMSIVSGYLQRYTDVRTVGLCHSVQTFISWANEHWLHEPKLDDARFTAAGINHMAWLLSVKDRDGNDLMPLFKQLSREKMPKTESVRIDIMDRFGYLNSEDSCHTAEYHAWYIKNAHPELLERYQIPLDEYLHRCETQIREWGELKDKLMTESKLEHKKSHEYGAYMIEAMETDTAYRIHGNVLNDGLITNLPRNACVEVPIMVDGNGLNPCAVGDLPEACAAMNRTNINVHLLTIQAAKSRKRDDVYMAAYMDPHNAAELTLDEIKAMCDDLFEAHGDWLPAYH